MIESRLATADGVQVHLRRWEPAEPARGAVVVVHGASEHGGRYARTAERLAAAGFRVLCPDLRGHGLTARATGQGVIGEGAVDSVLGDIDQVVSLAKELAGPLPVVLLGHSMGSLYALRYSEMEKGKLAGLVLSGPVGVIPAVDDLIAATAAAVDAGARDEPVQALSPFNEPFEPARTRFDWLSRDAAEVDAYLDDPMCGDEAPLTYGFVLANLEVARDGVDHVADMDPGLPVLMLVGERDPVSAFGASARDLAERLERAGVSVTARFYPDARHEVLHELNRDEVHADLTEWLLSATFDPTLDVEHHGAQEA